MPPKKKSLAEVANATSKAPMKLRSPSSRKPAKIHTPEPAAKRGGTAPSKKQPPKKPPSKLAPSKKPPFDIVVSSELETPTSETATQTPKKRSIQLQLRRSPRCSSKLRVHMPSNPADTETLDVPPPASKYPPRTLSSSSHQQRSTSAPYPSLTPSPQQSAGCNPTADVEDDDDADKVDDFAYDMAEDDVFDKEDDVANREDDVADQEVDVGDQEVDVADQEVEEPHGDECSDENEADQEAPPEEVVDEPLSIRCNNSLATDSTHVPGKKRKRRGVVCGAKLADLVHRLGTRIKMECTVEANGPVSDKLRSMMTHQIGSCVREKVPMLAPTYSELDPKHWDLVTNYLSPHFFLPEDDTLLWEYITRITNSRFKDWKSDCRSHYLAHGEKTPKEFTHREEEWKWLVKHFQEPAQLAISARMKDARKKKMNHHSGKTPFTIRAVKHMEKGHKAPFVAAYEEVYSQEPESRPFVEQMQADVRLLTDDHDSDDPASMVADDPLPTKIQVDIIYKAVGQKKGTVVSGVGGNLKRPPRPRGGASNHALKEELIKAKEDAAKKDVEFECRIRYLEEMVKGGVGASGQGGNVSDGASFGLGTL